MVQLQVIDFATVGDRFSTNSNHSSKILKMTVMKGNMVRIEQHRSRQELEPELEMGQYISVTDLMTMLSDLAVRPQPQSEIVPVKTKRTSFKPELVALPGKVKEITAGKKDVKTVEDLAQELWELRLVSLADNDYYHQQLNRFKNRFLWLTVAFIGSALGLGMALGWTMVSLKRAQTQLGQYEGVVTSSRLRLDDLERERLGKLQGELRLLQTQIPDNLAGDVKSQGKDVEELKTKIRQMETKLDAQDKALSVLVDMMQGWTAPKGKSR